MNTVVIRHKSPNPTDDVSNVVHQNRNDTRDNFSLNGLQKGIDNMSGDSFMGLGTELFTKGSGKLPACDFYETEENYCLSLKLPGISKEYVNISLSSNNLIMKSKKSITMSQRVSNTTIVRVTMAISIGLFNFKQT